MKGADDRFRVEVTVQPRAKRSQLVGWHGASLKLQVAAPPVDGAANAEVVSLLAGILGVSRRQVRVVRGETSRAKLIEVGAPASACRALLELALSGALTSKTDVLKSRRPAK